MFVNIGSKNVVKTKILALKMWFAIKTIKNLYKKRIIARIRICQ